MLVGWGCKLALLIVTLFITYFVIIITFKINRKNHNVSEVPAGMRNLRVAVRNIRVATSQGDAWP